MGWAIGFDGHWSRDIGYGVPAYCDHPDCNEEIDRGLAYVCCNQQPYGGDDGCGLYFCEKHRDWYGRCEKCQDNSRPFIPKPDHPDWVNHKATDPSWAGWRKENPEEFCYAEGDEGSKYCGDPKRMHCAVLGDAVTTEHLVKCMRDDHFIHHSFLGKPST